MKTYQFGTIDWTGVKSVLAHTAWAGGLTAALVLLGEVKMYDFGTYTPIAAAIFTFVVSFIKKLAETYSVTLPDTTVKVTEETGPVTPIE